MSSESVKVKTNVGTFRGYVERFENKAVNVFKGIRYGKAPVGELRWKQPEPYSVDENKIVDATKYGASSYQLKPGETPTQSEDCLFLNIWAPSGFKSEPSISAPSVVENERITTAPSVGKSETSAPDTRGRPLPVLFYIHGGGWNNGTASSDDYDGRYVAALGDVIVVTINYRLNVFGFLYGGREECNQGLHDQLFALKWVRENIEEFGGDKDQITILGQSAGSWSVVALVLSPLAKGLFKRAIAMSGSIYHLDHAARSVSDATKHTLQVAKQFGCLEGETAVTEELMNRMRRKNAVEVKNLSKRNADAFLTYGTEFLPKSPDETLASGDFNTDIDFVFGVVDDEGAGLLKYLYPDGTFNPENTASINLEFAKKCIEEMNKTFGFKKERLQETFDFYLSKDFSNNDSLKQAVSQALGDAYIVCPTIFTGRAIAKKLSSCKKAYSYRVTRKLEAAKTLRNIKGFMGVGHCECFMNLFGYSFRTHQKELYSEEDRQFSRDLIWAWSTFARTGSMPKMRDQEWQEALAEDNDSVQYLQLDLDDYRMVKNRYDRIVDYLWE